MLVGKRRVSAVIGARLQIIRALRDMGEEHRVTIDIVEHQYHAILDELGIPSPMPLSPEWSPSTTDEALTKADLTDRNGQSKTDIQ